MFQGISGMFRKPTFYSPSCIGFTRETFDTEFMKGSLIPL